MTGKIEKLESELKKQGILRVGDLIPLGYPKSYLSELEKQGRAVKQARGIYTHPDADIPPHYSQALACKKVPGGVICLLSALTYHEIGTQNPHEVWMAIDGHARPPEIGYPPLRIVHYSGAALEEGVQFVNGEFPIRVYSPAKTVADCFKYRNKIGLDVAIEALREGWRQKRFKVNELDHYARICRVGKVITPYLQAIL